MPVLGMAWIYKRGLKWWGGWRSPAGNLIQKSLKTSNKKDADAWLVKANLAEHAKAANALTDDFIASLNGRVVEKVTASKFISNWLADSESVTTKSTMNKYRQVTSEFSEFAAIDSKGLMLEEITVEHVAEFLAVKRKQLAHGTVKGYRRILSSVFLLAHNRGLIKANPVALAKSRGKAKTGETTEKRPFTLKELGTLHKKANPFWRYMIMAGYFSGQSLGDLATMRAATVDLRQNIITMNRRKTGKQVIIPISTRLRELLISIWPKDGKGYFWPDEAARYLMVGASPFSQEFYDLMSDVGLVSPREDKQSRGTGRNSKRMAQKLGFHNVRHTFVTHLKIGGAMDSVAKELAGHGSDAVSAVYTHLPPELLGKAIKTLPEFVSKSSEVTK